jgi:hypothetical protein
VHGALLRSADRWIGGIAEEEERVRIQGSARGERPIDGTQAGLHASHDLMTHHHDERHSGRSGFSRAPLRQRGTGRRASRDAAQKSSDGHEECERQASEEWHEQDEGESLRKGDAIRPDDPPEQDRGRRGER